MIRKPQYINYAKNYRDKYVNSDRREGTSEDGSGSRNWFEHQERGAKVMEISCQGRGLNQVHPCGSEDETIEIS